MDGDLPGLAVFWQDTAFSVMEIAQAARGLCTLVFVTGWDGPSRFPPRLAGRLGEELDVGGRGPDGIARALKARGIGGLTVFTDPPQVLAAEVAERVGLAYFSPPTALMMSDKMAQRQALAAAGLAVPRFTEMGAPRGWTEAATAAAVEAVGLPAVLKPRRGAASRATFLVRQPGHLSGLGAMWPDEDFLLESYLADCEPQRSAFGSDLVSVESIVEDGRAVHLAVTGRFAFDHPFRDTGGFLPSDLEDSELGAVKDVAGAACSALGVRGGALHTELKLTPSGPVVVEVNGRVGGNVPGLLARAGGPQLLTAAMRQALGLGTAGLEAADLPAVAFVRFVRAPLGARAVTAVKGLEQVAGLPGVAGVRLLKRPGEAIDWSGRGADDQVVAVDGVVAGHKELSRLDDEISEVVEVTYS